MHFSHITYIIIFLPNILLNTNTYSNILRIVKILSKITLEILAILPGDIS